MNESPNHWNLYWVASDGFEDCFVVARNSRSACSVESQMNGFELTEVEAIKIMRIPERVVRAYKKEKTYKKHLGHGTSMASAFLKDWERNSEPSTIGRRCYCAMSFMLSMIIGLAVFTNREALG